MSLSGGKSLNSQQLTLNFPIWDEKRPVLRYQPGGGAFVVGSCAGLPDDIDPLDTE